MNTKELKFLCMKEVEAKIGFKKSWVHERVKEGVFPPPIKIGGASRWLSSDIDQWMEQYITRQNGGH